MNKIKEFFRYNKLEIIIILLMVSVFSCLIVALDYKNSIEYFLETKQKQLELSDYNITYYEKELPEDTRGKIVIDNNISSAMIVVNKNLTNSEKKEVITHEMVHLLINDAYQKSEYFYSEEDKDPRVEEVLATGISNICK